MKIGTIVLLATRGLTCSLASAANVETSFCTKRNYLGTGDVYRVDQNPLATFGAAPSFHQ